MAYLVDPQGDDGTTGAHDIAVTGAADLGGAGIAALGNGYLLFDGFGDAHGVDGVCCLVGGEADNGFNAGFDGGGEHVVGAYDIGLNGFHGEELAGGYLLEGGGMEDVVDAGHGVLARLEVADVADEELDFACIVRVFCLILVAHIVLLLLVAREYADFCYVGFQKAI